MLRLLREEKGAAIAIVALSMTAMIGFTALVVDVGNLYLNQTRLVNMADAAALAGVQDLPGDPEAAIANARNFAVQNGMNSDTVNVVLSENNTVVTVNVNRSVPFYFAQLFDMNSANVAARAVAAIKPITAISGVVPFGVEEQELIYGQTYTLKDGAGDGYSGNYGALALGGNGANVYRGNIKEGYSGLLSIGDWVSTEPGNMSGPTGNGVEYRISLDPTATFATVQKGSPRILIVPIIASLEVHGRSQVQIV
ncbi:MAG: Tad domain-containing protein, partial [Sporomusaceae bacterium]|nr:Tad domain-containing protein [Sporomusaceae bacterium]